MKKSLLLTLSLIVSISVAAQTWIQKSNFPGTERYAATGFEINGKLYMGTGYNGVTFFNDWWEYDPSTDQWTQKASFPVAGRVQPSSFVIGSFGYVIFGSTTTGVYTFPTDFWEYDPASDQWNQKANFPGPGRYTASSMSINGKGYVGIGWKQFNSPTLNDWWEYDPQSDTWTQKANFGGGIRRAAMGFALNNKGYLGLGEGATNAIYKDLWEYDPISNIWTQKSDFPGYKRAGGAAFVLNNYGYVGNGVNGEFGDIFFTDFYKYDPQLDSWSYAGGLYPTRFSMVSVGVNNCAYIITGKTEKPSVLPTSQNTLQDFWEFCPLSATITTNDTIVICPGESVLLSANPGACFNYQWQVNGVDIPGATGINYNATTTGTYSVIVSNNFGSIASNSIVVTLNSLPAMPGPISGPTIVCSQTLYTYSVPPVPGATGYFWIVSSQSQIFSGQGTNTVTVYFYGTSVKIGVSAINECGLGKQNAIKLNVSNCHDEKTKLSHESTNQPIIYPNPSSGEFYIYIDGETDKVFDLIILDSSGKIVHNLTSKSFNNIHTFGKSLPNGVYYVKVNSEIDYKLEKIVKLR